MLDFFIVLGQVPGTNYFLSFADVLWLSVILVAAPLLWRHRQTLAYEWLQSRLTFFTMLVGAERFAQKIRFIRLGQLTGRTLRAP